MNQDLLLLQGDIQAHLDEYAIGPPVPNISVPRPIVNESSCM